LRKAKSESKESLDYEDNLGNNELNISIIADRLIEFLGEDFANEFNYLFESFDIAAGSPGPLNPRAKKYLH
jgi:hypothetical protein